MQNLKISDRWTWFFFRLMVPEKFSTNSRSQPKCYLFEKILIMAHSFLLKLPERVPFSPGRRSGKDLLPRDCCKTLSNHFCMMYLFSLMSKLFDILNACCCYFFSWHSWGVSYGFAMTYSIFWNLRIQLSFHLDYWLRRQHNLARTNICKLTHSRLHPAVFIIVKFRNIAQN